MTALNPGVRELSAYNSYEALDRFLGNRDERKIANNTTAVRLEALGPEEGRAIAIILHHTKIVTFYEYGGVTLNSGGYRTATTKQRMRQFLPPGWLMDRDWTLRGRDPYNQPLDLPFYDGIGIPTREGFPPRESRDNPPAPHILTGHHTEARTFRTYEDALSAAQGLGIAAKPQRNLSKAGWVVMVEWEGEPYYYRGNGGGYKGNPARQLWYPGGVAIGKAHGHYLAIPVESLHGWDFVTLRGMFPQSFSPERIGVFEARLGYEHSGQHGYRLFKVRAHGKWTRPLPLRSPLAAIPGVS